MPINNMKNTSPHNYHDMYFEPHHWLLKLRQTIIVIFCWLIFFIPIIITVSTYIAYRNNGRLGHFFWYYAEGFRELDFLMIFLTFSLGIIAVFCLALSYIQVQRSRGLVNKWPLFDINQSQQKYQAAEKFMSARFGNEKHRQAVRYLTVKPSQNLSKNQLQKVINEERSATNTNGL